MKRFISLLVFSLSFIVCIAQTPKPINQYPSDSIVYISTDEMLINKYYSPGRYQLYKISPKNLFACDSIKQNKLNYGQDSIRVTINRDTIKTTLADSNSSTLIYITSLFNNATLYVSAIHTGHYFVIKSTAWTKGNMFNWLIINNP